MTVFEFWNQVYGDNVQDTKDYTGRPIKKVAYGQKNSRYGWVVEYILPLSNGGSDCIENMHIASIEAYYLRKGKLTFTIDGVRCQVQKSDYGYSIYKIGDKKMDMWEREFGNVEKAEDFAGRTIYKSAKGNENSAYGWDIDHIMPLALGGKDNDENKQIVHLMTNDEKADKTTFEINGSIYQVKKTSKSDKRVWANGYDYSQKKYCIEEK